MKRSVYIVIFVLLLITSCSHFSPFYDKDPYISTLNPNGRVLFTQKLDLIYEDFNIELNRITVSYNPDDGSYFGAIEGCFVKWKANYYIKKNYQGNLNIVCPENGIILFASDSSYDISDDYINRTVLLDSEIFSSLVDSYCGFYIENPTELSFLVSGNLNLSGVSSILCTSDGKTSDFIITATDEESSEVLLKIIRTSVSTELRKSGNKIDIEYLNTIISTEKNKVFLNDQDFCLDIDSLFDISISEEK